MWHFTSTKLVAAIFGGKMFRGSVLLASVAPVVMLHLFHKLQLSSRFLYGNKLYCLVTEAQECQQLAKDFYAAVPLLAVKHPSPNLTIVHLTNKSTHYY